MGVNVTVLGSGSAGNCALIETAKTRLLVDAGLSARQIRERLATIGRSLEQIDAIIVTHEHSDHVRALPVLSKSHPVPIYANRLTAEAVAETAANGEPAKLSWRLFTAGQSFEIGDFTVESFAVPHDAYDPVNYVIRRNGTAIGVLTDLGHVTKLAIERMRGMDFLLLEANHDVKLLQADTARPWATKQRILSRHGHLSNEAAACLVTEVLHDRLRHVVLAHLSRDCNRPDLALKAVNVELKKTGVQHVQVNTATQDAPTITWSL